MVTNRRRLEPFDGGGTFFDDFTTIHPVWMQKRPLVLRES